MELHIAPDGTVRCLYGEELDLSALGIVQIARASHVEPDELGGWQVDLSPVGGPALGPFDLRSQALAAERGWLTVALETLPPLLRAAKPAPCGVKRRRSQRRGRS